MAISSLGFNTDYPIFQSNIQDRERSGQRFFDVLTFAEMICSVTWNSPLTACSPPFLLKSG